MTRNQPAAVGANAVLAEQRIVDLQFLHVGHDLGAVTGITAHRLQRLQVMSLGGLAVNVTVC